jgi:hypothetical protein
LKEITKIPLSTIEPVQATKGLVNNNTVVGDRPFETIAKSQANIFGNNVINSVETDVSVPNENTVNDATAYPSTNPMNNILTTRSNSKFSELTSATVVTMLLRISVVNGYKMSSILKLVPLSNLVIEWIPLIMQLSIYKHTNTGLFRLVLKLEKK